MKVLNISFDDYANYSYDNCQALRSVGIDAHSIKRLSHPFGYENESQVIKDKKQILKLIDQYDVIQLMHSYSEFLRYCMQLKKKTFVYHTGSNYRANPEIHNKIFNSYVAGTFTDQCEFVGLGAKNLVYMPTAIDVSKYPKFGHEIKSPYIVAHYPSNPQVKGTVEIIQMMKESGLDSRCNFQCSAEKVPHKKQHARVDKCDIYVELFKPILNGKPYGCYGVSAFEAAAAGKIVITQNIHEKVYEDAFGECEFIIANDRETFINKMDMLLKLPPDRISRKQTETYFWLVNNHSYEATGKRLVELLK